MTSECYHRAVSAAPQWAIVIVSYVIIVLGTLSNALALWCLATCTKTQRPMKVLLFSVFLPILAVCVAMVPLVADAQRALLTCFPYSLNNTIHHTTRAVIAVMVQIELISIAAIAVVRAAAVWAPQRPTLGMRGAVALVVVTCIYVILSTVAVAAMVGPGRVSYGHDNTTIIIFAFVNTTLPSLITAAAYILLISVIQRNKRRLGTIEQQARVTTNIDQVMRAMLAVFISNLVLILPHTIYRLTGRQPVHIMLIFEVILLMHFVVDPLVYIWFNGDSREKVLSLMKKMKQSMSSCCISQAIHQTGTTTSCDQYELQTSYTHTQEDSPL